MYPAPPSDGPTTSWTDCSLADDPSLDGGDLSWLTELPFGGCSAWPPATLEPLALGPTADIGVAVDCSWVSHLQAQAVFERMNGSAFPLLLGNYFPDATADGADTSLWGYVTIDPFNDLLADVGGTFPCAQQVGCKPVIQYFDWFGSGQPDVSGTEEDCDGPIGLMYCNSRFQQAFSPAGALVPLRSGIPDGAGGSYRFGALDVTQDFGCGSMVPTSASSGFVVHLDASSSCVYGRVLPVVAAVVADAGGAILSASSTTSQDLGCGPLAAAAGGSTLVTRLDPSGACVYGASFAAPGLAVADAPDGSAVLGGTVGAVPVDLGGGPMAPLGSNDVVLGELSASGAYLWSRRFGGAGITFAGPWVTVSAAGNVYLRTGWSGSVDLGGGPIAAASHDTVVGSYDPTGALRWARDFPIAGTYEAGVDACGALVVASIDPAFDPGMGTVLPPLPTSVTAAVARFAP